LSLGVAYSVAITPWRLRLASALPALIGLRTLQVLEKRGPAALAQPVKVPRSWVYHLLLQLLLSGGTPSALRRIAQGLGAPPQQLSLPAPDGTMRA
jgi:farnesyl-diphosphate farnesyltransferase